MKISFDVKNQILSRTDKQNVIANSTDYLEAEVTFSEDWDDLEKNMQFVNGDNVVTMTLTEDDGKWVIGQNQHLNLGIGTWKASIIGVGGDQRIITNAANLAVRASGWIGVGGPIPSVYEQLLTIIQSLHTEAASSAVIRSAVQQYIVDNYDALVKEVIIVGNVKEIIDDLVDDGTISELLDPIVAAGLPDEVTEQLPDVVDTKLPLVVADQLTAEVADQLPAVVATECAGQAAAWLSDHVDPDTGYVIDNTLTIQLAAADAKKVGDEVTGLKSALTDLENTLLEDETHPHEHSSSDMWETGNIGGETGVNSTGNSRMRTISYLPENVSRVITYHGYVVLYAYNNDTYVGKWTGEGFEKTQETYYFNDVNINDIRETPSYANYLYRLVWFWANHTAVPSTDYTEVSVQTPATPLEEEVVSYKNKIDNMVVAWTNGTKPTGIIGMFEKWAVIGTSYDCGTMYLPDGTSAGNPYMGWAQQLARRYGNTQERLASGGMRTNLWLNVPDNRTQTIPSAYHNYNIDKLITVGNTLNMVMIVLGCNDAAHGYDQTGIAVGSVADAVQTLPQPILSGQTFAYYYSCVICAVKQYAPQAKIIICHSFLKTSGFNSAYNGVIDDIAELFELPVIKQEEDVYFKGAYHDSAMLYTHPIGANYSGIATAYDRLIDKCVYDNYNYFKDYVGGGTEPEPV